MSFDRISRLAIPADARSSFTFYQIPGRPCLHVRPTGEANAQYMNAMFKRSKGIARRLRSGEMSVDLLEETRDIDLNLYPKYVVLGWDEESVLDDKDKPAKFTGENVSAFLMALPNDLFDDLRSHCGDLSNFRYDGEGLGDDDVEALAGN